MVKIYAIVPMYKPNLNNFIYNLEILSSETEKILIMDNSEDPIFYNNLIKNKKFITLKNIIYIRMPKNLGLEAINIGAKIAKEKGADFILLMDQDSTPKKGMVAELLKAYNLINSHFKVPIAAIGPTMINKKTQDFFKIKTISKKLFDDSILEVNQIPTSGMFIPTEAFFDIGEFYEDLFLDIMDFEWCWRAKKKGYKILKCKNALLEHKLGENIKRIGPIECYIHSAERQYYLFRNSIFAIMCGYAPIYERFRYLCYFPLKLLIGNLFSSDKKKRLNYALKGLKDGIKKWLL